MTPGQGRSTSRASLVSSTVGDHFQDALEEVQIDDEFGDVIEHTTPVADVDPTMAAVFQKSSTGAGHQERQQANPSASGYFTGQPAGGTPRPNLNSNAAANAPIITIDVEQGRVPPYGTPGTHYTPDSSGAPPSKFGRLLLAMRLLTAIMFVFYMIGTICMGIAFVGLATIVGGKVPDNELASDMSRNLSIIGAVGLVAGIVGCLLTWPLVSKSVSTTAEAAYEDTEDVLSTPTRQRGRPSSNGLNFLFPLLIVLSLFWQFSQMLSFRYSSQADPDTLSEAWNAMSKEAVSSLQQAGQCCGFSTPIDRAHEPCRSALSCLGVIQGWLAQLDYLAIKMFSMQASFEIGGLCTCIMMAFY